VPRLILLNGPPAAGKSTLAQMYADEHPLTLNLDIDKIRSLLGGRADAASWQRLAWLAEVDESPALHPVGEARPGQQGVDHLGRRIGVRRRG